MKRVLFVDDEIALLDGLRTRLHGMRSKWEMVFVESASRALTEMELRPFDVVVTDMRMPLMDGAQFLSIVADRWPQSIRIVLSGYAEQGQTQRLLPVAHRYLSKPCDARQLENAIGRSLQLQALLQEPRLRSTVGRVRQLPTMPKTYTRLVEAMSGADPSIKTVADLVSEDPAIAAKVLQIVNSSFFRLARQITKLEQAVTYLGLAAIRNVVLSVELFSQWRNMPMPAGFDPEKLQAQAQRVAAVARVLATGTPVQDDAMLVGLLHNIGYLVFVQECPRDLEKARQLAGDSGIPLHEAERQVIGASHAEVGAYLLGLWGLPDPIIEAIAFQHTPQRVAQTQFDPLAALVTAKALVSADTPNPFGVIETADPAIDDTYLEPLHAPFDWAEAQRRTAESSGERIR